MTMQSPESAEPTVGARARSQVEEAYEELTSAAAAPNRQTQLSRGALAGYLWALGRADVSPVTGSRTRGAPDLPMLIAEIDAVRAQLREPAHRTVPRDYTQGVYDALAWVCGHTVARPY